MKKRLTKNKDKIDTDETRRLALLKQSKVEGKRSEGKRSAKERNKCE